ncbi:MAG TPA: hypothetical protein PKN33_17530 [Phycisphaerae bacterium]|nr:hypothetical protein [Phycisphaerae bacterium]
MIDIEDESLSGKKRNLAWGIALLTLLSLGALTLIALGLLIASFGVDDSQPKVVWTASSGEPFPRKFCHVAFPVNAEVPLLNQDGSAAGIMLDRALACTESERNSGDYIGVWEANRELKVAESHLTLVPDVPNAQALIANWKDTVKGWPDDVTDYQSVDVSWEVTGEDAYRVTLQMKLRKGSQYDYVYSVSHGALKPESYSIHINRAANLGR